MTVRGRVDWAGRGTRIKEYWSMKLEKKENDGDEKIV